MAKIPRGRNRLLGDLPKRVDSGARDALHVTTRLQDLQGTGSVQRIVDLFRERSVSAAGGDAEPRAALLWILDPDPQRPGRLVETLSEGMGKPLLRIDLAEIVSPYIGETEKNLRRVFEAAEAGGAILVFDEADALFGKRSEVGEAHDRFANLDESWLLCQLGEYSGPVAVLARPRECDDATLPDATLRLEWRPLRRPPD
ncbi:AAA family ATPase [Lysobacter cavernae]|uniref:AAA family ATPase n=1 Tax=Lysobacter cavernae TaxID=1685901 RepID=A0ABV7RSK2_9GAMM